MRYGIVHYRSIGYHTILNNYATSSLIVELQNSKSKSLWNEFVYKSGLTPVSDEPTPKDLFEFVKLAFEIQNNVHLDIDLIRGYIASTDGTIPVRSDQASRLFSEKYEIYIDELILASLFEYVSAYYLWSREYKDKDASGFCFKYVLTLLNYTNRLGILTNDDLESSLVKQLVERYDISALNLISDLYWSCLAFAFCHEIAHIYLKHTEQPMDDLWKMEYDADTVGYKVYLKLVETAYEDPNVPFSGIFHDYLYTAPMILFQFYEDTYFMSYWLFGERAGNSHPPLRDRMNHLFEVGQHIQCEIDPKEGNILLNSYMDVSDWFREQLILKLQKGKLHSVFQEGFAFMSKNGYHEALQFQKNMYEKLQKNAEKYNLNANQLTGLWDTAVDIELLDEPSVNSFIWSYNGKTYSTKAFNVRFSLKKVLTSVLEFSASFTIPESKIKAVLSILLILVCLLDITTFKLDTEHAKVLIKCKELKADIHPIREEELLQVTGASNAIVNDLSQLGCIELNQGTIQLNESILIQ